MLVLRHPFLKLQSSSSISVHVSHSFYVFGEWIITINISATCTLEQRYLYLPVSIFTLTTTSLLALLYHEEIDVPT